ncbi:MAG: hypothetical protein ACLFRD_08785, partial [Nitriliruptoraceae bacterium]
VATGETVLPRWFVVLMLILVPVAIGVTIWGFLAIDREPLSAAERRPAGDGRVTIERGEAQLAETREVEPGPDCGQAIRLVGDEGSRSAAGRALASACELIESGDFPEAREGLVEWIAADGQLRMATFELSGVESSARVEDERVVVELNAKFQFQDAALAGPALVHQLVLIADEAWPGEPVGVTTELDGAEAERRACERLEVTGDERPRGCRDVDELLALDDPAGALLEVGFRDDR